MIPPVISVRQNIKAQEYGEREANVSKFRYGNGKMLTFGASAISDSINDSVKSTTICLALLTEKSAAAISAFQIKHLQEDHSSCHYFTPIISIFNLI